MEPSSFVVLTASSDPDAKAFDDEQSELGFRISRMASKVLLPTPALMHETRRLAQTSGAGLVVIDPALPLGLMGPRLGIPYAVVLHGAELTAPGHIPIAKNAVREVLAKSVLAICAGDYVADEVRRMCRGPGGPRIVVVPPGVDTERYHPLTDDEKAKARYSLGLPPAGRLVTSVSRLVPRKGMDILIRAGAALSGSFPDLTIAIGGSGRDSDRLQRLIDLTGSPARLLGRIDDGALPDLYGSSDVFVMACRDRWFGLEQEGFGIVFVEAAACEVPQIAGRSGGSAEAVVDGETGLVVDDPSDPGGVAVALRRLLSDQDLRRSMGESGRRRVVGSFDYSDLSFRLARAIAEMEG